MMRKTFCTVAVISALAFVANALWPDGRPGPSPRQLVAQDEPRDEALQLLPVSSPRGDADQRAAANLQQRMDVDYVEQPFQDVLDDLAHHADLQFYVKGQFLDDYGIPTDFPVTLRLKDVSVETALELILEPVGLKCLMRDGVLLITTEDDPESFAEVRVYNCRDLLEEYAGPTNADSPLEDAGNAPGESGPSPDKKRGGAGAKGKARKAKAEDGQSQLAPISKNVLAQFGGGGSGGGGMVVPKGPPTPEERLMDILQYAVMPDSWEAVDGPGSIGEFDGMIVIRHEPRAHRQVEQVLQMLRDAAAQRAWWNPRGEGGAFGSGGGGGFF